MAPKEMMVMPITKGIMTKIRRKIKRNMDVTYELRIKVLLHYRHSRERGNPVCADTFKSTFFCYAFWIPAFAGMTFRLP
jgi:hypothetical protein